MFLFVINVFVVELGCLLTPSQKSRGEESALKSKKWYFNHEFRKVLTPSFGSAAMSIIFQCCLSSYMCYEHLSHFTCINESRVNSHFIHHSSVCRVLGFRESPSWLILQHLVQISDA